MPISKGKNTRKPDLKNKYLNMWTIAVKGIYRESWHTEWNTEKKDQ
jgi:hypothetical protein